MFIVLVTILGKINLCCLAEENQWVEIEGGMWAQYKDIFCYTRS